MNLKKIYFTFSHNACNVYVLFYYKILWFYQDFKSENPPFLVFHKNTGPVSTGDVKSSQMKNKTHLQL